jgi:hypothetical protein
MSETLMSRTLIPVLALSSLVFVGACSSQESAGAAPAGAAPAADSSAKPAPDATAETQAVSHPLTKSIVTPPRPGPGEPHGPGFDLPLIDLAGYAPSRPMDVVQSAYMFTADHPEVSSFVPCYCGCGNAGHKDNADCFVRARDAQGRVTEWEPHGAACAVCIDVAIQSMRMRNSGASVSAIARQIRNDYRQNFPDSETPTPAPPTGK